MSGKYALIIGNTEYNDPGLAKLTAPGKDAEDFGRILKDKDICAFDDVNILLDQPSSSVIEAIDEFFDQKKPDDLLVLYFSGHGIRDEIGSLYLAFKNTIRSRLRSTAIKSDYIREAMDQSRSKRQVLILDCCNSGAFPQGTKAELGGAMGMTKAFQGYGRFVLTASDATQFAWEGDKVIGETGNSLFTHFLVKGLNGEADSDGDGKISVDELYDYAYHQISKVTPKQTPTKSSSKQEGEIILRENMRIEDIKPISLPDDLKDEIEDTRPYVREIAVQKLEKILRGKNIGLSRSAREALEKIADDENTTRRVAQAATQVLEAVQLKDQNVDEKQKATEEADRLAAQKAEEKRIATEKADTERKAKEAKRLAAQKAEDVQLSREKAKAQQEAVKKTNGTKREPSKSTWITFGIIGGAIIGVVLCGFVATRFFPTILGGTPATPVLSENGAVATAAPSSVGIPAATQVPVTQPASSVIEASNDFRSSNPTTFFDAESGISIDTLDPALAFDTASENIIQNTYETLVFYDGEATDKFVPMLAESWDISANGKTYTFKIRQGVKFHNGDMLTPSDVAYSFQRGLLQGGISSPQYLLTEPFFGLGIDDVSLLVDPSGGLYDDRAKLSAAVPATLKAACETAKVAIVADDAAGTVTMTLKQAWGPFLPTIAQTWGAVMDKKWIVDNKGWDGSCDTWQNFYGMASADDPFSAIENGTGPFKLESLKQGEQYTLVRYDDYFRGPAKLERIVAKAVPEWSTRFAMMQAGDADSIVVPTDNRSQMDELVGERCVFDMVTNTYKSCEVIDGSKPFRLRIGRPGISMDVMLYNFAISSPNPYLGSGQLDGNGIPPDFFADIHIRKAFAYCFDWSTLINDVFSGEAIQSFQLPLPGMPGYFPDTPHYTTDLDKCKSEFEASKLKSANGRSVMDVGFRFQLPYNQGNASRQTLVEILAGNLAAVNGKFVVEQLGLPWPAYLRAQRAEQLPLMTGGWQEDIHDPHDWYQPYTTGTYGGRQSLPDDIKAKFNTILNQGVSETDPATRAEIYKQANQLYYDQAIGVPLVLVTSHSFEQRWVFGRISNPMFPDTYYYPVYKQ